MTPAVVVGVGANSKEMLPFRPYVLSWIPEELIEVGNSGIEVNPEECIAWLDQINVGIRPIVEMLQINPR
jgi:hypothetical protein